MALPDSYKQVEYIQSSWTTTAWANWPYIDTWFKPKSTTRVKFKANFQSTADWPIYWAWTSSTSSRFGAWFWINPSAIAMWYWDFNWVWWYLPVSFDTDVTVEQYASWNTAYNIVDWTTATNTATFVEPNLNMYIFARNGTTSTEKKCPMKLYYFKIYDNWTLVRDFIPVLRISDNKPWLYDLVNNVFYANAGTGEFTYAKSAESGKIQKILLATNLIRPTKSTPSVIEETYTVAAPGTSWGTPLWKSWYKIIKLIAEHEAYTTNTWRWVAWLHFYWGSNQNYYFHNQYFLWASYNYWYSSTEWWPYGASRIMQSWNSTALDWVRANSWVTSSQRSATRLIYTENTLEYHIGQTYWNWTQEWTITFSNAAKTAVQSLFSDPDFFVSANWWNNINPYTFKQVTVTYQSI